MCQQRCADNRASAAKECPVETTRRALGMAACSTQRKPQQLLACLRSALIARSWRFRRVRIQHLQLGAGGLGQDALVGGDQHHARGQQRILPETTGAKLQVLDSDPPETP